MATLKLTDRTAASAKAEPGQRVELWDEQTPGLCLRVSDKGKKVWVWRYRTDDGRQPRLTLGDYSGAHGLKWAREQVEELRVQVRKGADPAAERRRAKAAAKAEPLRTFRDLSDAYLRACRSGEWTPKNKRKRASTLKTEENVLNLHILPRLGDLRLEDVDRPTVRGLLRSMTERKIGARTNKAHAIIRQCFAYAIFEGRVQVNPAVGFPPLAQQKPRARVLTDGELKALWAALSDPTGLRVPPPEGETGEGERVRVTRSVRIALQLALLLLQRRSEVAGMALDELNLEQGLWLIPGERMKGGRPHLVPLPPLSVQLVEEAIKLRKGDAAKSPYVFPSPRDREKPIRADSVTHAMAELTAALGIKGVSPHDLRRTGSTALTSERIGVSPFIRSQVLGHTTDAGGGAAVSAVHYDANTYIAEKRRALQAWEALVLEVAEGRPRASNVVALELAQ